MTPIKSGEIRDIILGVAVIAFTATLMIVGLSSLTDGLGPKIGDIISFTANSVPSVSTASITANSAIASPTTTCVLDVQVIQQSGGSFVVEATRDRSFQVHWSGKRTKNGSGDCGGAADLLLNSIQIEDLILAAGGKGIRTAQVEPYLAVGN